MAVKGMPSSPHLCIAIIATVLVLSGQAMATSVRREFSDDELNYSFVVLSDTHLGQKDAETAESYLRAVVAKVNYLMEAGENIKLVVVTGDVTDSGEDWTYRLAKDIMDEFSAPVLPLLGNHDVWKYNKTWEEEFPTGDFYFVDTFAEYFKGLPAVNMDPVVPNPEHPKHKPGSVFPGWQINIGRQTFFGLDYNGRKHAIAKAPGLWPACELHDFEGGTFHWLSSRLAELSREVGGRSGDVEIALFHHQPYKTPVPDWLFAFNKKQKASIRDMLESHFDISKYWGAFAGHVHRWFQGTAFDEPEWKTFQQWESRACKSTSAFTLVRVENGYITSCEKRYGIKDDVEALDCRQSSFPAKSAMLEGLEAFSRRANE